MEAASHDVSSPRRRADESLVRSLVGWGRLTGGALGLVVVGLLILVVFEASVYQPRVDRLLTATATARLSHEAMLDQQSGLRGFLPSGDDRFLEAYRRGQQALPPLNVESARLLGGEGRLGGLLLDMRLAQQTWIDRWATQALEVGRTHAAVPDGFVDQDKTLFDDYRQRYDALITELVTQRDRAIREQRRGLAAVIAFALAVAITAGVLGARRGRRLRRALGASLDALTQRLDQIGHGDLAPRGIPDGPTELQLLAAGLEESASELSRARREADDHAEQLASSGRRQAEVLTFAREVSGSLSLRYVLRGVCKHSSAVADGARVVVWLMDPTRPHLESHADSDGPDLAPIGLGAVPAGEGLVGRAGQYGRIEGLGANTAEAEDGLALPMVVGAQVIGVLQFLGGHVHQLPPDAVALLETMAIHAAGAIEAARLHERTSDMAMTDVLTGLPNRRRLDADLQVECSASARYDRPLSLLMIDVDHFKAYNDAFGHPAGDAALQAVGGILGGSLRDGDHAYRYGGEEFALVLRETDLDGAVIIAERLRAAVEHHFSSPDQPRQVTISAGAAEIAGRPATPEALTAAADSALYNAKRAGRNQVKVAVPPADTLHERA